MRVFDYMTLKEKVWKLQSGKVQRHQTKLKEYEQQGLD